MVRSKSVAAVLAAVVVGIIVAVTPAVAAGTASVTNDPVTVGRALAADTSWVVGAEFVSKAGSNSAAVVAGDVVGMPTSGEHASLLSTGDASIITDSNTSASSGSDLGGSSVRGNSDYDVTILRVDINVPATANCLVGMDFRFLSEEFPEYVGSAYNDAFIAELDKSTWTTSGSTIEAPDNFAFDPTGSPITINAAGSTSMSAAEAGGTTFDGATPLLTAATPVTPGDHSLYLSIFDQGDNVYDSAVLVDNLRLGKVANVATDCKPGATVVDKSSYVALGDSYSSGFGNSPYFPGTHRDAGPNDCQRSTRAYGPVVAQTKGLNLDFHACQGAVTKDFLNPRNSSWGEIPQLNHLTTKTGVVTFSVGGNDSHFADVLAECILGFELLPFNTCYKDDKVLTPVRTAFQRLDGKASSPTSIVPYATLYRSAVRRAPIATRVAVGYPHFYTASGSDRTFLPGGRCEGVKKADQRWVVEKIDELNGIIERNARRNGFLFANPNPRFDGHELCSGGSEWIYPLLSAGRVHPKVAGHRAIADSVLSALNSDDFKRFTVMPKKKIAYSFFVGSGKQFISLVTGWPGSDVSLTLVSPSGRRIDRSTQASDVTRVTDPTSEQVEVRQPEPGTWTAELFGEDVAPDGEETTLSVYQADTENKHPTGRISTRIDGESLILDASGSTDPDGSIVAYDWYIAGPDEDRVEQGPVLSVPLADLSGRTFTLVVVDDRGASDFVDLTWIPIDVMPGSSVNPIKRDSRGVTPIALLSSPTFDATTVAPTTVRVGPDGTAPREQTARSEDVNGDGLADQILHVRTQGLKLSATDAELCLELILPDGRPARSCDRVSVR